MSEFFIVWNLFFPVSHDETADEILLERPPEADGMLSLQMQGLFTVGLGDAPVLLAIGIPL